MAIYINPPNESKEAFLARYAKISRVSKKDIKGLAEAHLAYRKHLQNNKVFLFHVLNPGFTALVIADSPRELHYMANDDSGRPVQMYEVNIDDVSIEDVDGRGLRQELDP